MKVANVGRSSPLSSCSYVRLLSFPVTFVCHFYSSVAGVLRGNGISLSAPCQFIPSEMVVWTVPLNNAIQGHHSVLRYSDPFTHPEFH
ncbi:hypothetical protein SAMN00790413_05062 [Deinococcus hopiensis KR-140]|uniref:Uncharacterized protein n=1 Tax=Deinococcus hopiensis KR-140 TaxID=695939 RepID=A0A1W1UT95_9DEIO|nr:hypothetical protein SAMN00790413_05062 [Deinococcus hopiensis KR-140]